LQSPTVLHTPSRLGPAAAIFDAKRKKWFAEREWAEDIEHARQKAEPLARKNCKGVNPKESFPQLRWIEYGLKLHFPFSLYFPFKGFAREAKSRRSNRLG
jgi:hypothetical protein